MKSLAAILLSAVLFSCVSGNRHASTTDGNNNVLSVTTTGAGKSAGEKGAGASSGGGSTVIFEGSNNLFDVVQAQSAYFDESRDVIVIQGNGNIIKLYNTSMVNMASDQPDTLVLVGNKVKYLMCVNYEPKLLRTFQQVDTVQMKNTPLATEIYTQDLEEGTDYAPLIQALLERIAAGDDAAYYELAEMYKYGENGTPISIEKAIDLYEYGAVRGDKMSIRRLGDLWFNGSFDRAPNKAKGRYYYSLGAQMGDTYCQDALANK